MAIDPKSPKPTPEKKPVPEKKPKGAGWFSKIAPGVRRLVERKDTPSNLWVKCPDTG